MGLFDRVFRRRSAVAIPSSALDREMTDPKTLTGASRSEDFISTYSNRNATFRGDVAGMDYDRILRDIQNWQNFVMLCKLAHYYVNKDPLFRGIIKEVYTPFSVADDWQLIGTDEKIKQKYEDYYDRIDLKDFEESALYQYWLYGNVVCYLMPDGSLITLPFQQVRIGGVMLNGEPLVEYYCTPIQTDFDYTYQQALKLYVDDSTVKTRLRGLPPEVVQGLIDKHDWVQLNPHYTFVLQDVKESWLKYAPPLVAACLSAFRKKELISEWEDAQLNLGIHSFLHVKYGDPHDKVLPDNDALMLVGQTFKQAMKTSGLAITDCWAEPKFHQPDLDELFSDDKYKSCNSDILDAGGISGIIVSGRAEDGSTFASAQVSMQTAAMRIRRAKDKFCQMMDKINQRVNELIPSFPHSSESRIPKFRFPPTDLTGDSTFLKTCETLFNKGMLSNETYLTAYKFDFDQEVKRKKAEADNGISELFSKTVNGGAAASGSGSANPSITLTEETQERGRPTMEDSERHSDPSKSFLGRQPKASNPEGSEAHGE